MAPLGFLQNRKSEFTMENRTFSFAMLFVWAAALFILCALADKADWRILLIGVALAAVRSFNGRMLKMAVTVLAYTAIIIFLVSICFFSSTTSQAIALGGASFLIAVIPIEILKVYFLGKKTSKSTDGPKGVGS